jgi:hypothetical protein
MKRNMNGAEKDSERKSKAVAVVSREVIFFSFLLCFARSESSANPYPKTLLPPDLHLTLILLISGTLTLTKT